MHFAFNDGQFEKSLTGKVVEILKKHINVYCSFYKNKGTTSISKEFKELPYRHSGPPKQFLNILYMYRNNIQCIRSTSADLVWISATASIPLAGLFIYRILFPSKKFYIQLYTPSVNTSWLKRFMLNTILAVNLKFYKYIFVGNVGNNRLQKKFGIPDKKALKAGLGMPDYGFKPKDYSTIKLLYIGTITQREVWKTIKGIALFLKSKPEYYSKLKYDIIGSGKDNDVKLLTREIEERNLGGLVNYHGFLPTEQVKEYIGDANVGINFLPMVGFYNNSSTKTLEYLIAGLPVISTRNPYCLNIIREEHGVFCDDTPESFAEALSQLIQRINTFNPKKIRESFIKYSMEEVIKTDFVPKLMNIINQ